MDTLLPSGNIFRELQDIHDTGYFSAQPSLEDHWQQVRGHRADRSNGDRLADFHWYLVSAFVGIFVNDKRCNDIYIYNFERVKQRFTFLSVIANDSN